MMMVVVPAFAKREQRHHQTIGRSVIGFVPAVIAFVAKIIDP